MYVERTDDELEAAYARWAGSHAAPHAPVPFGGNRHLTPKQVLEEVRRRTPFAQKFLFHYVRLMGKESNADPVDLIESGLPDYRVKERAS